MHVAFNKIKYVFTVKIVFFTIFRCDAGKARFHTYPQIISRSTIYDPKVIKKSCLLIPDFGPCRGNIEMYHFEPTEKKCVKFKWGGCQGNGNRFDSEEECLDTCLSKPDEKTKQPRYCALAFDYGFCFGDVKRWYYDRLWKTCKETVYSGCGGNKNNFYSMEQCDSICRFGTGRLGTTKAKIDGLKKILIINPLNTTPARGKEQRIIPPNNSSLN